MVKLTLEIKEDKNFEYDNIVATGINVTIVEYEIQATKGEIKAKNLIKQKLNLKKRNQIVNECRNETNKKLVDLLDSILN